MSFLSPLSRGGSDTNKACPNIRTLKQILRMSLRSEVSLSMSLFVQKAESVSSALILIIPNPRAIL